MPNNKSINLLRSRENHFWDDLLKWALSVGRFLIIVTETVALAAFAYRFTLDRQIIDLGDSIKQHQAIVTLYKDQEIRYRNLHERLAFAATIPATEPNTDLLKEFVSAARGKVIFQKISVGEKAVIVEASATSTGALSAFLDSLKTIKQVKSVSVDRVENKAANGLIFINVTAELIGAKKEVPVNEGQ